MKRSAHTPRATRLVVGAAALAAASLVHRGR